MARSERQLPSPWEEMERWFDEAFRRPFFSLFPARLRGGMEGEEILPPADIYEDGESVVVKMEIPGMDKHDINVELMPDSITISGKKSSEEKVEQKDFHRIERSYGSFTRRFHLPVETMTEKAKAVFRNGVLEVRIPKSESARKLAHKVTIE